MRREAGKCLNSDAESVWTGLRLATRESRSALPEAGLMLAKSGKSTSD
jgi:hypothetical protein